jgi:hypothetical protein
VVELRQEFPAHTPTLDEVRDKVTQQYKNDKALEMAKNDAETLKAKSKNLETMRTAAVDMGLTVTVSSEFTRAEAANVFGMSEAFNKIANQVQKNEIRVTSLGKENEPAGYFVWYVADKIAPNQSDFRKELPAVTRALARDKAEVLINEFLRDRWQQERKQIDIGKAFR